jgi:hypothetical protein
MSSWCEVLIAGCTLGGQFHSMGAHLIEREHALRAAAAWSTVF